jgi:hypothetical protein
LTRGQPALPGRGIMLAARMTKLQSAPLTKWSARGAVVIRVARRELTYRWPPKGRSPALRFVAGLLLLAAVLLMVVVVLLALSLLFVVAISAVVLLWAATSASRVVRVVKGRR